MTSPAMASVSSWSSSSPGQAAAPQIVVVQNWTEELKRLVPTR